jgi:hypothetical protein
VLNTDAEIGIYCQYNQIQGSDPTANCYFEDYIKGTAGHTVFKVDVHAADTNYKIEMNKIMDEFGGSSIPLKTEYPYHVFCFAEDDWKIEAESAATTSPNFVAPATLSTLNKMTVNDVENFASTFGILTTLDETAPSFTYLQVQNPTAYDTIIAVSFALNEAGTTYCRATRSDSGETAGDMAINRILTAAWSAEVTSAGSTATIDITYIENVVPYLTNRDDQLVAINQAQLYDIYCWAKDSAVDSMGRARPNHMSQTVVGTSTASASSPQGGATLNVWVTDSTTPTMIYVSAEAVTDESTLQITLQLSEPGTVWCQVAELLTVGSPTTCKEDEVGTTSGSCYFESFIKGQSSHSTVFRTDFHQAYVNYDVEVNRLHGSTPGTSPLLSSETGYKVFCFAEDDWLLQVQGTLPLPNYNPPAGPIQSTIAEVTNFMNTIGLLTTLDLTPPSIAVQSTSTDETRITVTLQLNEVGTAYCRAVRSSFAAPTVLDILETNFQSLVTSASLDTTVLISAYDADGAPLVLGTDYDVYCYAEDDLCHGCDHTAGTAHSHVLLTATPVRTADTTPPALHIVRSEAIAQDRILITLRVDEGALVWCGAWQSQPASFSSNFENDITTYPNCHDDRGNLCGSFWVYDLDDTEDSTSDGIATFADYGGAAPLTIWKFNEDVRIVLSGLTEESTYNHIYCFSQDDEATPNKMTYNSGAVAGSKVASVGTDIGTVTTLDESPPSFTQLEIQDPTASNDAIIVTFKLNEAGTAYCRPVRTDSGQAPTDVPINRIMTANWYAAVASSSSTATIRMDNLENVDASLTNRDDEIAAISQATQYDVYCWARDDAASTLGADRFNYISPAYTAAAVTAPSSPAGGTTSSVWVTDSTPPVISLSWVESVGHETFQLGYSWMSLERFGALL